MSSTAALPEPSDSGRKLVTLCTGCGQPYHLKQEMVGLRVKCPKCGHSFIATSSPEGESDADLSRELEKARKTIEELQNRLSQGERGGDAVSVEGLEAMTLRIGADYRITYANTSLCRYLGTERDNLVGQLATLMRRFLDRDIYSAIARAKGDGTPVIIRDKHGKSFEVKRTIADRVQDIVIVDKTEEQKFRAYTKLYVSSDLASLSEDDLRTFKVPERRFMTVSFTDLRGFTALAAQLSPEEVRMTVNAYLEEIITATEKNKATVDKIVGDEVMVLYGAPRHYADHAFRAIVTVCEQITQLRALQKSFARFGKTMPDCGIGVNTGEMVIGNMGSVTRQVYTVIGSAVNIAARLCDVAKGMEILTTEHTLKAVLAQLPEGWQHIEARSKHVEPPVSHSGQDVEALPKALRGKIILIGPGIRENRTQVRYQFRYLHAVRVKGIQAPIPVIAISSSISQAQLDAPMRDDIVSDGGQEKIFGKYRLLEFIAKGGMGEVWKARDPFGNIMVIKTLLAGENASASQLKRFRREADVMAHLYHRNICRIHEVGEVDGVTFIAMEYVEGVSLADILNFSADGDTDHFAESTGDSDLSQLMDLIRTQREKTQSEPSKPKVLKEFRVLPLQQTLSIVLQITNAIQFAHEKGILHRDLKPGNILVRPDGEAVVTDFGLAKMENDAAEVSMTVSGQIMGTIEYMAPEQAESTKDVDEQADVFSLGAVLYQMLTGHKHYLSSGNLLNDILTLKEHRPESPRHLNPKIDLDLEIIVLKALRNETSERYRNMAALREDLERYRLGEPISARPMSSGELFLRWVKKNKAVSGVVAASLLILTLSFFWYIHSVQQQRDQAIKNEILAKQAQLQASQNLELAQQSLKKYEDENRQRLEERKASAPQYHDKALAMIGQHRLDVALEAVSTAVDFDPGQPEYLYTKVLVLLGLTRDREAAGLLEKVLSVAQEPEAVELNPLISALADRERGPEDIRKLRKFFVAKERFSLAEIISGQSGDLVEIYRERLRLHREGLEEKLRMDEQGELHLDLSNQQGLSDLGFLSNIPVRHLNFDNTPLTSLYAVRQLPLRSLSLVGTGLISLRGIEDIPLVELRAGGPSLSDFSSLKKLSLKRLELFGITLHSFDFCENLPLEHLSFTQCELPPLASLRSEMLKSFRLDNCRIENEDLGFPNFAQLEQFAWIKSNRTSLEFVNPLRLLEKLELQNSMFNDLQPVKTLHLKVLDIRGTPVSDISPLRDMALRHFLFTPETIASGWDAFYSMSQLESVSTHELKDIESFARSLAPVGRPPQNPAEMHAQLRLNLENYRGQATVQVTPLGITGLDLSQLGLKDLSLLKGLALTSLNLTGNPVASVDLLKGMPLDLLHLADTGVSDISPLLGMPLSELNLDRCPVDNFSTLETLALRRLSLNGTRFDNPGILRSLPLTHLELASTAISHIKDLDRLKLVELHIQDTPVSDLKPISAMSLERLLFSPKSIKTGLDFLYSMKSLKYLGSSIEDAEQSPAEFWSRDQTSNLSLKGIAGIQLRLKLDNTAYQGQGKFKTKQDQIIEADLRGQRVKNLAALKGLPLQELSLSETDVESLEFAAGMPLKALHIEQTPIRDLTPLADLRLEQLTFSPDKIENGFSILLRHPTLKFAGDSPTAKRQTLSTFFKKFSLVSRDASPTQNQLYAGLKADNPAYGGYGKFLYEEGQLQSLDLSEQGLQNISALKPAVFLALNLRQNPLQDISSLQGKPLTMLDLGFTSVRSLMPLKGMPLKKLFLPRTPIKDIVALADMPLNELDMGGTDIKDLTPLAQSPLKGLSLWGTQVRDISVLKDMPLEYLDLSGTLIADLKPLAGGPIRHLLLAKCSKIEDLSPLLDCQHLEKLVLPHTTKNLQIMKNHPSLKTIGLNKDFMQSVDVFFLLHKN